MGPAVGEARGALSLLTATVTFLTRVVERVVHVAPKRSESLFTANITAGERMRAQRSCS